MSKVIAEAPCGASKEEALQTGGGLTSEEYAALELRYDGPIPKQHLRPRTSGPRQAASLLIQATKCENDARRRDAAADAFDAKGDAENAAWMRGIGDRERDQAANLRREAAEIEAADPVDVSMIQKHAEAAE